MTIPPVAFSMQPDVRLIVLAAALAVAAGFVSFTLFHHAGEGRAERRAGWLILAAVCSAFGVWAAHLVAVLAHNLDTAQEFDLLLTAASLFCVVIMSYVGFSIAARSARWHAPVGGAINGAGMSTMHYLGVYAVAAPGVLVWNIPTVVFSVVLGIGLSSAALTFYQRVKGLWAVCGGAGLLTLAVFALHFTSISAAHPISVSSVAGTAVSPYHWVLAVMAAVTALIVLLLGIVLTLIDRQTARDNVRFMQQLVDAAIEGIVVVQEGRVLSANRRIGELLRIPARELVGRKVCGGLLEQPVEVGTSREMMLRTDGGGSVPVKVVRKRLPFGVEVYAFHDLSDCCAVQAELQSQNEILQQREAELRARNVQLDTALKHMSQGLCMYDTDERVVLCNERYATIYGLSPEMVKPGMSRREVINMRIAHGVWAGGSAEEYLRRRTAPISATAHIVQEMSDGRSIVVAHVPMPGGGWVSTHEDVTEQIAAQAQIAHLARHDGLTDLPNRVLVREELQEALARMRPGEGLAVHSLDLDRFKEVNDALGHGVGDELLQEFGGRLQSVIGESDTLARVTGDEFIIVQNPAASPRDATDLAAAIMAKMSEPFVLGGNFQVVVGVSIGIAMAPGDGGDADQLLKNANLALHRAKQEDRGKYRFFEQEMDARMRARHVMERNLRNALANGELDLAFQPLLNLKRNEISCFEALLRWRTADGVEIEPSEFVPLAEETGLIVPIGEWALRRALAEAANWSRPIRVAVNLSPVQFSCKNLTQTVMSALAATGVPADRLELEITESLFLQDGEETLATLHQLRDLGVRIALDDFGTGFSSLNYLRAFPLDKLKMDRCFIAGLAEGNEESLAIVRAVARLGASLGIATVAEGVETQSQLEIARKEGFTEIQGFWLSEGKGAAAIADEYHLYQSAPEARRTNAAAKKPRTVSVAKRGTEPAARKGAKSPAKHSKKTRSA